MIELYRKKLIDGIDIQHLEKAGGCEWNESEMEDGMENGMGGWILGHFDSGKR